MRYATTAMMFIVLLIIPLHAFAVPAFLNHQGHIVTNSEQPLGGVISVTFTIYNNNSSVWDETLDVVFDNGFYSVALGTTPEDALEMSVFDGSDLYLGITVDDNAEMEPRTRITSVPYAMLAGNTELLDGEEASYFATSSDLSDHGDNTSNPHSVTKDQVGLGNVTNDAQLTIDANLGDLSDVDAAKVNLGLGVDDNPTFADVTTDSVTGIILPTIYDTEEDLPDPGTFRGGLVFLGSNNKMLYSNGTAWVNMSAQPPEWVTEAGDLGSFPIGASFSTQVEAAIDGDNEGITYSVTPGENLPAGLSIDENSGVISGNPSEEGDFTFRIRATSDTNLTTDSDTFSINIRALDVATFNYSSTSYQSWTMPDGVTEFDIHMWGAAGGTGSNDCNGAGGAGGYATARVSAPEGTTFSLAVPHGGWESSQNGGGGGYAGIFAGSPSASTALVIAGGGGGSGTPSVCNASSGGGATTVGQTNCGGGAGQSSGGATSTGGGGSCVSNGGYPYGSTPCSGQQFQGGTGCGSDQAGHLWNGGWPGGGFSAGGNGCNGAGGGGGWYGGGGGGYTSENGGSAAGGSSYVAGITSGNATHGGATVLSGSTEGGNVTSTPPQTGHELYPGGSVGYGRNTSGGPGSGCGAAGNGYIVISF